MAGESISNELARLVWLLVYRPGQVEDQKHALRGVLTSVRDTSAQIKASDVSRSAAELAEEVPRPERYLWLAELSNRLFAHSVRSIEVHEAARAADLLGLARALAMPGANDEGRAFDAELVALAATSFSVHIGRDGFVRNATPPHGIHAVQSRRKTPSGHNVMRGLSTTSILDVASASTKANKDAATRLVQDAIMPPAPGRDVSDLVMRLRGDLSQQDGAGLLDELGRIMEDSARAAQWTTVVEIAARMLDREESLDDPALRRLFGIQFRRLAKPTVLRAIIQLLPVRRELRRDIQRLLVRQGEPAADLLVEMLAASENSSERRAYRDAIVKCPSAALALIHLLRDVRWFVVRNAAELLGELNAREADQELINALRHPDPRVRRAATFALIKLGTPRAMHTIVQALQDAESTVRLKAAIGLGAVKDARTVPALLAALDREEDPDVLHAVLGALGSHPSGEVVARLAKESSSGSLLRRRPLPRRLAAVAALGVCGTLESRRALEDLERDKDRAIRDAAAKALALPEAAVAY